MSVLRKTRAYCERCGAWHPATVNREGQAILGVLACPHEVRTFPISEHADLYETLTGRSEIIPAAPPGPVGRFTLNYVPITTACNFNCRVCGMAASGEGRDAIHLDVDEIVKRAEDSRRSGGMTLHLFGGEPTVHPRLLDIVTRLHARGFKPWMVTNGYKLGKQQDLARALKTAGLARACIQLDSLNRETLAVLGRDYLDEKLEALRNTAAAGLDIGLNCTVTQRNLCDLPELLGFGLEFGPAVRNITFATAAPVGRYELEDDNPPDREAIVMALLRAGHRYGFTLDDILPMPSYPPWRLETHPDCGVHVLLLRTSTGIRPLNSYLDMRRLYQRMARTRRAPGWYASRVLPAVHVLASVRPRMAGHAARLAAGLLAGGGLRAAVNISVTNYRAAMFPDEQRLARCAVAFHTSRGPVKGCLHCLLGETYPGSRANERLHGRC